MDEIKMFCINGTKKIIFRKEGNVFICFDPIDLEFYEVNMTGACILFLVSEKYSYKFMVDTLIDWFELKRAKVLPEDYDFEAHKELVGMQPGDVEVTFADVSELERDMGFKPGTPLVEGLRRFAKWYKSYYNS